MKRTRAGFTLLEVMISVAVLAIVAGGIYSALSASQSLYSTGITRQEIEDRVRRALNDISLELRQASSGLGAGITFATSGSAGDQTVTFCMCTGFTANVPTWSAPITFATVNGDGELDNGADDNSNRLVDERKLMRTQAGRPDKLIADNVREGSVRFVQTLTMGLVDRIQISLTIQGYDNQGRVIEASGSVTVDIRNQ
jgi:prepilin-type N-terminal cleavage/methylation domain-containing protein